MLAIIISVVAIPIQVFEDLGGIITAQAANRYTVGTSDEFRNLYRDGIFAQSSAHIEFTDDFTIYINDFDDGGSLAYVNRDLNATIDGGNHDIRIYSSDYTINNGIFNYIGNNGSINNVNFKMHIFSGHTIRDSKRGEKLGIIANQNYGKISQVTMTPYNAAEITVNVAIDNIDDLTFGLLVGYNDGIIEDVYVEDININFTISSNLWAKIGLLVGENEGYIRNVVVVNTIVLLKTTYTALNYGEDDVYVGIVAGDSRYGDINEVLLYDGSSTEEGYYNGDLSQKVEISGYVLNEIGNGVANYDYEVNQTKSNVFMGYLSGTVGSSAYSNYVGREYESNENTAYFAVNNDDGNSNYSSVIDAINDSGSPFIQLSPGNPGLSWQQEPIAIPSIQEDSSGNLDDLEFIIQHPGNKLDENILVNYEITYSEQGQVSTTGVTPSFSKSPKTLKAVDSIMVDISTSSVANWVVLDDSVVLMAGQSYPIRANISGTNLQTSDFNESSLVWDVSGANVVGGNLVIDAATANDTAISVTATVTIAGIDGGSLQKNLTVDGKVTKIATLNADWQEKLKIEIGDKLYTGVTDFAENHTVLTLNDEGTLVNDTSVAVSITLPIDTWTAGDKDPNFSWSLSGSPVGIALEPSDTNTLTATLTPELWNANNTSFTINFSVTDSTGKKDESLKFIVIKAKPTIELTVADISHTDFSNSGTTISSSSLVYTAGTGVNEETATFTSGDLTGVGSFSYTEVGTPTNANVNISGTTITSTPWIATQAGQQSEEVGVKATFIFDGSSGAATRTVSDSNSNTFNVSVPLSSLSVSNAIDSVVDSWAHSPEVDETSTGQAYLILTQGSTNHRVTDTISDGITWTISPVAPHSISKTGEITYATTAAAASTDYTITADIPDNITIGGTNIDVASPLTNPTATVAVTILAKAAPTPTPVITPTPTPAGDETDSTFSVDDGGNANPTPTPTSQPTPTEVAQPTPTPTGGGTGGEIFNQPQPIDENSNGLITNTRGTFNYDGVIKGMEFNSFDHSVTNMDFTGDIYHSTANMPLLLNRDNALVNMSSRSVEYDEIYRDLYLSTNSSNSNFNVMLEEIDDIPDVEEKFAYIIIDNTNTAINEAIANQSIIRNSDGKLEIAFDEDSLQPKDSKIADQLNISVQNNQLLIITRFTQPGYDYAQGNTLVFEVNSSGDDFQLSSFSNTPNTGVATETYNINGSYTFTPSNQAPFTTTMEQVRADNNADRGFNLIDGSTVTLITETIYKGSVMSNNIAQYVIVGPPAPPFIDPMASDDLSISGNENIRLYTEQGEVIIYFTLTELAPEGKNIYDASDTATPVTFNAGGANSPSEDYYGEVYKVEGSTIDIPFFYDRSNMVITAWTTNSAGDDKSDYIQSSYNDSMREAAPEAQLYITNTANETRRQVEDSPEGNIEFSRDGAKLWLVNADGNSYEAPYEIAYTISQQPIVGPEYDEIYDDVDGIDIQQDLGIDAILYGAVDTVYVYFKGKHPSETYEFEASFQVHFLEGYQSPSISRVALVEGQFVDMDTNVLTGAYLPQGAKLTFEINSQDIPEEFKDSDGDGKITVNGTLSEIGSYQQNIPNIQYAVAPFDKDDTPPTWNSLTSGIKAYTIGSPEIIYDDQTVAAVQESPIELTGTPGQKIVLYIRVNTPSINASENAGVVEQFIFNVQEKLGDLTYTIIDGNEEKIIYDSGDADAVMPAGLKVGDVINININNADLSAPTEIYYTTNVGVPDITQAMIDEAQSGLADVDDPNALQLYNSTLGIPVVYSSSKNINIRAVATPPILDTSNNFRKSTSNNIALSYVLEELPDAEITVADPVSETSSPLAVPRNSLVTLSSATENAYIYYTVNNTLASALDPSRYEELLDDLENAEVGTPEYEAAQQALDNEPTKRVESGGSVKVEHGENGRFVLTTIASQILEAGATFGPSQKATFDYSLAKASAPTSNPATMTLQQSEDDDTVSAVIPKDTPIRLISTINNSVIYYTESSDLTPVVPDIIGSVPTDGYTKLYDAENPPLMPGSNFYLSAIQVTRDSETIPVYDQSDLVTFVYTAPAPVYSPTFSKNGGTVVAGTEIKLSIGSQENTVIFYRIIEEDDSTPSDELTAANGQLYDPEEPIVIDREMTIQAIGEREGTISAVAEFTFELADTLDEPDPSLDSGAVVFNGYNLELDVDRDARVIYTLDNSDPKDPENDKTLYGTNIVISGDPGDNITIRAYATATDYTPSETVTLTYTIAEEEDLLRASPASGATVRNGATISLSTSVTDGDIHYTTDGGDPSRGTNGTTVELRGTPGELMSITALVEIDDNSRNGSTSVPVIFNYYIMEKSMTPTASIPNDAITLDGAQVALIAGEDANIYYTTNGNDPTTASQLYIGPITINDSMILKSIATEPGKEISDISTYFYVAADDVIPPRSSINSGEIEAGSTIQLSSATEGATIYYTTDGSTPNPDSLDRLFKYEGQITITRPVTISMIAVKDGLNPSLVNSITYTVYNPPEEDEEDQGITGLQTSNTDRLESRRTYESQEEGPSYSDIVLQDVQTLSIISGETGSIPREAEIFAQQIPITDNDISAVKSVAGEYKIADLFDITLRTSEGEVQPEGQVEVGLPIPSEYQNGIVFIVKLGDDGTTEVLSTRRSGGIAYTMVDQLSRYAITVPDADTSSGMNILLIALSVGALALVGGGIAFTLGRKKVKTAISDNIGDE